MDHDLVPLFAILGIFVALPWIILHYVTRWKTAATLTNDDEALLEDLYQLAKRLDDRMDTVERLVSSDHPEFQPARIMHDRETDNEQLREFGALLESKGRTNR